MSAAEAGRHIVAQLRLDGEASRPGSARAIDKGFGIAVVLLPFLHQYAGFGQALSFGELLLIPFLLYYAIADRRELGFHVDRWLLAFYAVTVALSIVGGFVFPYFSLYDFLTLFSRLCFYAVVILVARRRFSWSEAKGVYFALVTVAALYLVVQYVYHAATGGYLPIVLSDSMVFPPEKTFETWLDKYSWNFRPSSLFLEPSYYALFTFPALVAFALDDKSKSLWRFALLVATYALSSANSGLFAALIVAALFLVLKKKSHWDYLAILMIMMAVVIYIPLNNLDWVSAALERFLSGGTVNNRVTRGFVAFGLLDAFHQAVGVGINNLGNYLEYYGLLTGFDSDGLNYCGSIPQTLNYSGVIGLLFLLAYMGSLYGRLQGKCAKALWLVLLADMVFESILFTYRFAFLVIVLEGMSRLEANEATLVAERLS